ncbi:hypothetical protein [Myroides odoratus]|nr:hypothetical protein [Myroides odoratus]WQD59104.1 hypothetical protein U0010_08125 [Myroides odoratus]
MKEIKKIIIYSFVISCMFNCNKLKKDDQSLKNERSFGTLYFVRGLVKTDLPVSCNNYLNRLDFFISYLKIKDEKLIDSLLCCSEFDKNLEPDYFIDVRYRIELEDKVICIDYVGNYSIEGKYLGKLSNFQLLLDYIEKHRESSVKLKEDFPFEDVK